MKKRVIWVVVVLVALCAFAAIAYSWSEPLLTAADSTLGENQKIEKQKAVITEIRTAVTSNAGTFSSFTAAIRANTSGLATLKGRYESYSTAHGL